MTKHDKTPLQRLLAMLLCLVMVVGMFPVTANAEVPADINPETVPGVSESDKNTEAVYLPLTFRDAHVDGIFFEHDHAGYDTNSKGETSNMTVGDTTTLVNDYYDVNATKSVEGTLGQSTGVPEYKDAAVQTIANRIKAIMDGKINVSGLVDTTNHKDADGTEHTAATSNIVVALRQKCTEEGFDTSTAAQSSDYDDTFASIANYYDAALWYLNNLWADGKIDENTPHMMKVGEFPEAGPCD